MPLLYSLPVLMYHSISRADSSLCVSPELFEDQCKTLAQAGWRGISLEEAEQFFLCKKRLPRKTCLFTFDDGYLDNYVNAAPILQQYGHQGTIFPVLHQLEKRKRLRPTAVDLHTSPEREKELPPLDTPGKITREGLIVKNIKFCSWEEIKWMSTQHIMQAAPHSLSHGRVVGGPEFTHLVRPGPLRGYFSIPPYATVWGMPAFTFAHALAHRAFTVAPELFELVKNIVPQERKLASQWFADPANSQSLIARIRALPSLGRFETDDEYRTRIGTELRTCRALFEEKLQQSPLSFCWPWGSFSPLAVEEAQCAGYRVFFTTKVGANAQHQAHAVNRIKVVSIPGKKLLTLLRLFSIQPLASICGALHTYQKQHKQKPKTRAR